MQDPHHNSTTRISLTIFPLGESGGWAEGLLEDAARKLGYQFQRKGPKCDLWHEDSITRLPNAAIRCV